MCTLLFFSVVGGRFPWVFGQLGGTKSEQPSSTHWREREALSVNANTRRITHHR